MHEASQFDRLSTRAQAMLQLAPRLSSRDELAILTLLNRRDMPYTFPRSHPVIECEIEFGGYTLQSAEAQDGVLQLGMGEYPSTFADDTYLYCRCATHSVIQVDFFIRDDGYIVTDEEHPIATSILTFIEQQAFAYWLPSIYQECHQRSSSISNTIISELMDYVSNDAQLVPETRDAFGGWWQTDQYAIYVGPVWNEGENSPGVLDIIGRSKAITDQMYNHLMRVAERLSDKNAFQVANVTRPNTGM